MSNCDNKKIRGGRDFPVDSVSPVLPELRANNPYTAIPPSPVNGGLFSGKQAVGAYASIPVPPTSTYYIHYNLRSANPPPGAIYHYPATNRMGNNYTPMPGIYWLNDETRDMDGRYHIKFAKFQKDQR
jgi:hypothetical protein